MNLKKKFLLLLALFAFTGIAIVITVFIRTQHQRDAALHTLKTELTNEIKEELKWITEVEIQEIERQIRSISELDQKIEKIREIVHDVRFFDDKSGYFFVYDFNGVTIALPPAPDKHGENRYDLQDSNGDYIVRNLGNAARTGDGYTIYYYPKPGATEPSPKLAYTSTIEGTNFYIGSGVYIDDVDAKVAETKKDLDAAANKTLYAFGIGALVVAIILFFAIVISISMFRTLGDATSFMTKIATGNGDLTIRMDDSRNDEIGQLGHGFNGFVDKMRVIISDLKQQVGDVDTASEDITKVADNMAKTATELDTSVEGSLKNSHNLSNSIADFSETTETVASDVNGVASAVEELNVTIGEVAKSCAQESQITRQANDKSQEMQTVVTELKSASDEINQVIEIISAIAAQTNLLALNATIEAASAGEAGKGFAVVANEVKELARQSADATGRIRSQVERIQNSSVQTIDGIKEMTDTIEEIDRIANSIAATVEEQSSTTGEIAVLTQRVADSIHSLSDGIEGISGTSKSVAEGVEITRNLSSQTSENAQTTRDNSQRLRAVSKNISTLTDQFIV